MLNALREETVADDWHLHPCVLSAFWFSYQKKRWKSARIAELPFIVLRVLEPVSDRHPADEVQAPSSRGRRSDASSSQRIAFSLSPGADAARALGQPFRRSRAEGMARR